MIRKIDHVVITTNQMEAIIVFYEALGFTAQAKQGRYELFAGDFKINVHSWGKELSPHAAQVAKGCNDFCFEVDEEMETVLAHLAQKGLQTESGIVTRHGVRGSMQSIYLRDPDGNLIELSYYST